MSLEEAVQEHFHETEEESELDEFDCTDDSDKDPSFDIVEETRSALSKLSVKKPRSRGGKAVDENQESESEREAVEDKIPKLDKKDEKSFEKIEQIIKEGGSLEKLTLDQCKVYLRKYGLRLAGNKAILLSRIREHQEIIDGCGEMKYPAQSFVLNCKGDACLGDVVIFEQKVYDMFNIASRSAVGPPCGTRTVAGRIVKESYGVAKQQHTFTIEVLWSKGEKALPPLHQLLIKGRNLYRIKTMRQRWVDEGERLKVLQEKHGRGFHARYSREIRIQNKEKRAMVIKRKNSTNDHIQAIKKNQHPQVGGGLQQPQSNVHAIKENQHQQIDGGLQQHQSNIHAIKENQHSQIGDGLQQPQSNTHAIKENQHPEIGVGLQQPQSILGPSPNSQNSQHMKHHHQAKYHGFRASELQNSMHVRPHHHYHQQHYMAKHHEQLHGGRHLQHKNYYHPANQFSRVNYATYVPFQQHPENGRRHPCHYDSQHH